ncbi:probable serine/threonine-protein kinase kinX isoform X2 [Cydia strobilella]|uniref:probable serine/threonine-protein kinase kinX isoform X2 n=1 Tax=Cydia strobilella TaxID=1100964 RepID=UPI003007BFE7
MPPGLFNCAKRNKILRYLLKTKECRARIKADQINVLRKQYDAFLEEDKKRKERNEHILEKLHNMRLSNTVARYKSNVYLDQRVSFNCTGEAPINIYPHPQTNQPAMVNTLRKFRETATPTDPGILTKPMDETYILNEISKTYILIPKLRSIAGEDYIPRAIKQDNNNDGDWKSKYSILDKLKQNEKEETNSFSVLKDNGKSFLHDIPTKEHKYRFDDEGNSPKDEIAEQDVAAKYATDPLACQDENGTINKITTDIKKEKTIRQSEVAPNLNTHSTALKTDTDNGGQLQQPNRGTAGFGVLTEQYTYPTQEVQLASHETGGRNNDPIYNDKHENEDNEKLSPVVNDIRHVEEIDPIKPEAQKTTSDYSNTGNSEKLQYPIDIINVQDFTPAEGVKLVDGVNINPDNQAVQETYKAPSDQNVVQAPAEHAYQPKAHQPQGDDQYGSQPTGSSEEVYLPGANQPPGGEHYVYNPTAVGSGAPDEKAYLPGDQQPLSGDQYVSEPVAVAAEQQEHITENTEQHRQGAYDQTGDVTSEIQAFEDEQNQMFYSEQANYQDYNQDPNAVGDGYSADTNYDPSLLYGDVQQEAAYPAEINEHEETSQRYDPSYEEQYAAKDAEQLYAEQQYSDQQYTEQQYSDQQYTEQGQYGDQPYAEQQYGEQQQYDGQQYAEQQEYTDQPQGEPVIATLQEYDQAYPLQEQTMEQIEQQLDNEEINVPSQDAVGDIVDESIMYAQNEGEVPATEQYVENQNPEPISPKL